MTLVRARAGAAILVVCATALMSGEGADADDPPNRTAYVAGESDQGRFEEPVDYVVPREDLEQFIHNNPDLGMGVDVVIGVDYDDWESTGAAPTGQTDRNSTSSQTAAQVIHRGGPEAAALDSETNARQVAEQPHGPDQAAASPSAACIESTRRVDDTPAVHLPCPAAAPATVAVNRSIDGNGRGIAQSALAHLLAGPTDAEKSEGISEVVPGAAPEASVTIDARIAHIDFTTDLRDHGLQSVHASSTFLQPFLTTFLSMDGIDGVAFSIRGDCEDFWEAMGSGGCHIYERDLLTPPTSAQEGR